MTENVYMPKGQFGFKPGQGGKPAGTLNTKTRERTELFRNHLMESNILFRMVNKLIERLEDDTIKTSDLINGIKTLAPYLVQTVSMDQVAEEIAKIATREDATRVAEEIAARINHLKVV